MRQLKLLAIGLVLVSACGGGGGGGSTAPVTNNPGGGTTNPGGGTSNTNLINLADQSFSPSTTTVPLGTTVTWQWPASCSDGYGGYLTCPTHSVTFDDGSNIASATQSSGTFTRTFSSPGTYKYHCAVHGTAMSGQIVVQ